MTVVTATPLEAALSYAALGWPVVPLHTPVAGVCDCGKRQSCDKPGKHPRTLHGLDDSTTDPVKIERWWKMWPHANIAVDLKRAGLIDVAPDSIEWHAAFVANGLPPTASFRSGGGDGHEHHFYQRPADCPAYRSCKPDQYDVMANGYAVMPPSMHETGRRYAWLREPDLIGVGPAPAWAVSMLKEVAERKGSNGVLRHLDDGEIAEAPPELSGEALQRWSGEIVSLKEDGSVDRSQSLWAIGCDLARAGASRATIAQALQDRDEALGWSKYVSRRDAQTRYLVIAERAINGQPPARLTGRAKPSGDIHVQPPASGWPEPEDRGLAVLSEQGNVEYIEDLVRPGRIVTWAAEEGVGKSYAVDDELAIRLCVAGGAFAGIWPIVQKGRVLILSEMHSDDDYAREELTLASLNLNRQALLGQYFRLSLMTAANGVPVLMAPAWREWVTEWCRNHEIKLAVFDTATGATQGDPWGDQIREVFRNLRVMLEAYPELAIILIVHLKKPTNGVGRRISDVMGEWGRWCDVIVMQERDGTRTKISTMKRVRTERRIIATRKDGLLIEPKDIGDASTKVPQEKVIEVISTNPGITVADLALKLGVGKATADRYVRAAEQAGHVEREQGGRRGAVLLYLTGTDRLTPHSASRDGEAVVMRWSDDRYEPTASRLTTYIGEAVGEAVVTAGGDVRTCGLCGAPAADNSDLCFRCDDEAEDTR